MKHINHHQLSASSRAAIFISLQILVLLYTGQVVYSDFSCANEVDAPILYEDNRIHPNAGPLAQRKVGFVIPIGDFGDQIVFLPKIAISASKAMQEDCWNGLQSISDTGKFLVEPRWLDPNLGVFGPGFYLSGTVMPVNFWDINTISVDPTDNNDDVVDLKYDHNINLLQCRDNLYSGLCIPKEFESKEGLFFVDAGGFIELTNVRIGAVNVGGQSYRFKNGSVISAKIDGLGILSQFSDGYYSRVSHQASTAIRKSFSEYGQGVGAYFSGRLGSTNIATLTFSASSSEVGRKYSVQFDDMGCANRATFRDRKGNVVAGSQSSDTTPFATGRVSAFINPEGEKISLTYTENSWVPRKVCYPDGRCHEMCFNPSGYIMWEKTPDNLYINYAYTRDSVTATVSGVPLGTKEGAATVISKTVEEYYPIQNRYAYRNLKSTTITGPKGEVLSQTVYEYDSLNRLKSVMPSGKRVITFDYHLDTFLISKFSDSVKEIVYTNFDSNDNPGTITESIKDAGLLKKIYTQTVTYNPLGRPLTLDTLTHATNKISRRSFSYSDDRLLTSVTEDGLRTYAATYNAGRLMQECNAMNLCTDFNYTSNGRLSSVAAGGVVLATYSEPDVNGYPTKVTYADGRIAKTTINPRTGRPDSMESSFGGQIVKNVLSKEFRDSTNGKILDRIGVTQFNNGNQIQTLTCPAGSLGGNCTYKNHISGAEVPIG